MQAFYLGTRIFSGKEGLKEAMGDSVSYTHLDVYKRQTVF